MSIFSPNIAYASLDSFLAKVDSTIINPLIGLMFALAIAYFLWGVFEFIANQSNEEAKTNGRNHMLWGVVGITIMLGVWGILNIIINTFNIKGINPEQGTVHLGK